MPASVAAGVIALALAAVHLLAGRLRSQGVVPRRWWLSVGGGVSVTYVFLHLLPALAERQARVAEAGAPAVALPLSTREHLLFLAVLAGFVAFYGLEHAVRCSLRRSANEGSVRGASTEASPGVFWLHLGSFAAYNALIGYLLLHREAAGPRGLALYAVAVVLHFVVNDHGLRAHYADAYHRVGRWLLSGAVLVGFVAGALVTFRPLVTDLLFGLLAGGIVLNVIKEELPEHRESRFGPFVVGIVGYAAVLVAL